MRELKNYIGIQFKEKGRTYEEGLDCWGLFRLFYQDQFNIELPSYVESYEKIDDKKLLGSLISAGLEEEKWSRK